MTRRGMWLRRVGLALGTLASAFWLFAVIVGIVGPGAPWSVEAALLALLVVCGALASVVAWQWQRLGSLLVLAAGMCFALFALVVAGRNQVLIATLLSGPFLLAGLLLRLGPAAAQDGTPGPPRLSRGAHHGESG